MCQEWSPDELVAAWTSVGEDWLLVDNKTGATRLGFALVLKFFKIDARFPQRADEVPPAALAYVDDGHRIAPGILGCAVAQPHRPEPLATQRELPTADRVAVCIRHGC